MPQIQVYHNPNFLDYRGRHADIVPPTRPVATVQTAAATAVPHALEIAYQQTQHGSHAWWHAVLVSVDAETDT